MDDQLHILINEQEIEGRVLKEQEDKAKNIKKNSKAVLLDNQTTILNNNEY